MERKGIRIEKPAANEITPVESGVSWRLPVNVFYLLLLAMAYVVGGYAIYLYFVFK